MRGGDDDGDIMMMIMASHAGSWCILRVLVAGINVMVGMVMVIIAILRQGMLKMLKMIAYERTTMAIMIFNFKTKKKLDPVGSTVRYEMMKLCTGSV